MCGAIFEKYEYVFITSPHVDSKLTALAIPLADQQQKNIANTRTHQPMHGNGIEISCNYIFADFSADTSYFSLIRDMKTAAILSKWQIRVVKLVISYQFEWQIVHISSISGWADAVAMRSKFIKFQTLSIKIAARRAPKNNPRHV